MADLDALVVWVKRLLNKTPATSTDDTGKPDNATIKAFINYERDRLYNRMAAQFPARFAAGTNVTYTGGSSSVTVPTAAQRRQVVSLFGYESSVENAWALSVRNVAELPNMGYGRPTSYAIAGTDLYVRPMPASDLTLRLLYIPALTALSSGSDTPSEFPADHHLAIGTLAAYSIARRNGDPEAEGLKKMADEAIENMTDAMRSMVQDDSFVQSAPLNEFERGY